MLPLLHRDVIVATLASGSRGNCTYVGDGAVGVLVDCGLSTAQVWKRLERLGLGDTRIAAVLVTHEHADHVGAARVLDERLYRRQGQRVPFHMTRGTRAGVNEKCIPTRIERVLPGEPFVVGDIRIEPWSVPHDTREPVAFAIEIRRARVGVITDLGRSTRLIEQLLGTLDVAVVEFNHDVEMLMDGEYPWSLKQRIRGSHGHLSNDQAAELIRVGASSPAQAPRARAPLGRQQRPRKGARSRSKRAPRRQGLGGDRGGRVAARAARPAACGGAAPRLAAAEAHSRAPCAAPTRRAPRRPDVALRLIGAPMIAPLLALLGSFAAHADEPATAPPLASETTAPAPPPPPPPVILSVPPEAPEDWLKRGRNAHAVSVIGEVGAIAGAPVLLIGSLP